MLKKLPKILIFLCTMSLIFGIAGIATATPYNFQMGDDSYIDTTLTADPGLVMWAEVYNLGGYGFSLSEGESETFLFARIGTHENSINDDDLVPGDITAHIDFANPDVTPAIHGETVGFAGFLHFFQGWNLIWDDAHTINIPEEGEFTLDLSDASFVSGFWFGPDGLCGNAYANVYATVTLDKAPNPVPEPATMLLLGSGLIGLATFGRRKFFKKV